MAKWQNPIKAAQAEMTARIEALEVENARLRDAVEAIPDAVIHHLREMYPSAWQKLGTSGQRSIRGLLSNATGAALKDTGE